MLFDASTVWNTLLPGTLVSHSALLDKLALAMLFSLEELALVNVSSRRNFAACALRDAFMPHAIVLLSV